MESKFKVYCNLIKTWDEHTVNQMSVDMKRFYCGEHNIKVGLYVSFKSVEQVTIHADIVDGEVMQLALLKDAISRYFVGLTPKFKLVLPYLPYARQDRVMVDGESFSLKVFCNMINSMGFDSVEIHDCHSDVGVSLLNNVVNVPQSIQSNMNIVPHTYDALVSPDGGALKKVYNVAKESVILEVIQASKHRDVSTGELSNPQVLGDVDGKTLLIVDDLCEGGFTFVQLAKVLKEKGAKRVDLYVTHGVFSKGKELEYIDNVYCKHDWTTKV